MARNRRMQGKYESRTEKIDGVVKRRCVFCGEWKELHKDYHKNGTKDGITEYRLDCKTCYNLRRTENKVKKRHSDFIGGQKRRGEEAPNFSHQEWKEVLIFFGGTCAFCGTSNKKLTRDHLLATSQGGKTEAGNIIPACASCNSSKGDMDFKEWFMKQNFFSQERLNKIFLWRTIMRQAD